MIDPSSPTVAAPAVPPRAAGWRDRLRARRLRRHGVHVGAGVVLGRELVLDLGPGATVEIADGAVVGDGCRFHVAAGAAVRVGAGAVLGARCAVVARAGVEIGPRALLADEVVIADARPRVGDVEVPIRLQGLEAAPVGVGVGARLGPGAVVGPGVTVGAGAQVGAHAVVEADVAPGAVVDGVPADAATDGDGPRGGPSGPQGR